MRVFIMDDYRNEIEKYCEENDLSAEKVYSSINGFNEEQVLIGHHDPDGPCGLMDDHFGPLTLGIFLENGKLRFMQTEHTRKYLSAHEPAMETAIA